jgi:hypothetical protein
MNGQTNKMVVESNGYWSKDDHQDSWLELKKSLLVEYLISTSSAQFEAEGPIMITFGKNTQGHGLLDSYEPIIGV